MHRHTTTQTIYSLQLKSTLHVQNDTNYLHSSNSCNILHNTLCSFQFDDRKKAKMPVNTLDHVQITITMNHTTLMKVEKV